MTYSNNPQKRKNMTPDKQQKIDKINTIAKRFGEVAVIVLMAMGLAMLIEPLLGKLGVVLSKFAFYHTLCMTYKAVAAILGIIAILSIIGVMLLSPWSTDEENVQKKAELKEIMQEIQEEKGETRKKERSMEEVACPRIDLNDKQKKAVETLLQKRIPQHDKDKSRFDRSVVYTYLRALRAMHKIEPVKNSDDIDYRRRWIEQLTGLYEPQNEWAHFRGDYDEHKRNNKVKDAIKEIEYAIEKFR